MLQKKKKPPILFFLFFHTFAIFYFIFKYQKKGVVLDSALADNYFNQSYPIVNLRIAQGGVRLAHLLNHIYGK